MESLSFKIVQYTGIERLHDEILHNIFIHVPFKQRLECMLVCQRWYIVLDRRSLLYDINLKSKESFDKFINVLQRIPSYAKQVEMISLEFCQAIDKRILYSMLPNLRVFKLTWLHQNENNNYLHQPCEILNPDSRLEMIKDQGECDLVRQLLMFGSLFRLNHLELQLNLIDNPRRDVIMHLRHLPSLTKLIMNYVRIGVEDVEIVHQNIPTLKTLCLLHVTAIRDQLPDRMIPATSITNFTLTTDAARDYPDYDNWYMYFAKKYTHLKTFQCQDLVLYLVDHDMRRKVVNGGLFLLYKTTECTVPYHDAVRRSKFCHPGTFKSCK